MATSDQINRSSAQSAKWLKARQAKHVKMVEESIKKLQADILASLEMLKRNPAGKIRGLSVNLGNAQKIHAKINRLFQRDFSKGMGKIIDDFKNNKALIKSSFKTIGESATFTSIDDTMMKVLRDGNYQQYLAIGKAAQDKVTQQVYDSVISGASQSQLASTIRGSLLGSAAKSVVGTPLANYARLYARDMIMNYHNDVILQKGEDLGMKHYKYVGTLMATSRDFCKRRVGLTYTKNQINSWKYKWKGKSGPAWTNRGGYNCRHHWQPVRPEWLPEEEQLAVGKLNTVNKKGNIQTPWQKAKAKVKAKPKVAPVPKEKYVDLNTSLKGGLSEKSLNKYFGVRPTQMPDHLEDYMGGGYWDLNKELRKGNKVASMAKHNIEAIAEIDKLLKAQTLKEGLVLRRGISFDAEEFAKMKKSFKPGVVYRDRAFVSTTVQELDPYFMEKANKVSIKIHAPKGSAGRYVSGYESEFIGGGEFEYLLPRNSKFKVKSFKEVDGQYELEVYLQ